MSKNNIKCLKTYFVGKLCDCLSVETRLSLTLPGRIPGDIPAYDVKQISGTQDDCD
jgi:hypothetical protein